MTDNEKKRLMTPSGRPRSVGLPPPPPPSLRSAGPPAPPPSPGALVDTTGVLALTIPKLDSTIVDENGKITIPWQQAFVNLSRVAQGTGITPGTYTSVTVNAYGQVTQGTSVQPLTDAPHDGHIYGRQNGAWVRVPGSP